jgi:hypothetical protein
VAHIRRPQCKDWRTDHLSRYSTLLSECKLTFLCASGTKIWIFLTLCHLILLMQLFCCCGPGSSVGIATELRAGRSGDRIPVGRDFPPVQTGPVIHPASCTMGTGSFPGVKSGRGVTLTIHPLLVPSSRKSRAITLPIFWATTGPVMGSLPLPLPSPLTL